MNKNMTDAFSEYMGCDPEYSLAYTRAFFDNKETLAKVIEEYLKTCKPPRWKPWLYLSLNRRREWVLTCIHYMWPWWFDVALECGAKEEDLKHISLLIIGYESKRHNPRLLPKR